MSRLQDKAKARKERLAEKVRRLTQAIEPEEPKEVPKKRGILSRLRRR